MTRIILALLLFAGCASNPHTYILSADTATWPADEGLQTAVGELSDEVWSYMANDIAKPFNVSPAVIECRINHGRIREEIRLENFE